MISLLREEERRKAVSKSFSDREIPFEWVDGHDWRTFTEEQTSLLDKEARKRVGRPPMRPSALGCWLSHRETMMRIIASGDRMGAVFEDDIFLSDDAARVLADVEDTGVDFDIVFLHRNKAERRFVPIAKLSHTHTLGIVRYQDWGTQGYVVTADAARRILEREIPIRNNIDHALHYYWENGLTTYTLNPPVVLHGEHSADSSIASTPKPSIRPTAGIVFRRLRGMCEHEIRRRIAFGRRVRAKR